MKNTNDIAIDLKNVFERYEIEIKTDAVTIREHLEALQDVSFSVYKGESLAIIGPNGAGKSTLLRLIAGLLSPDKGEIKVHGRVGSLLDLGAGFHPELTGRDNLRLNASLYNFSHDELEAKYEDILKFADIGKFIDVPVRCYSQGMYVRLAFSLAIHVDPDILLIDDCLSVGDDNFRLKSIDKALELKARNKTIIFVTHDFGLARQMCERGIYLRQGKIIKDADINEIIECYATPVQVDKERFKYLGAKVFEDEERKRIEEEEWRRQVAERRKAEEDAWVKTFTERCKADEESWQKENETRRRDASERIKAEQEAWGREVAERRKAEELQVLESRQADEEIWQKTVTSRRQADEEIWQKTVTFRRQEEEENWRKEDEERRRRESERRRIEEEIRVREEEARVKEEADRRKLQKEKRYQVHVLSRDPSLRLAVSCRKVRIFHNDAELLFDYGVRSIFMAGGDDIDSRGAIWKVMKASDDEIICFLRWPKPLALSQIWRFRLLADGAIDLEITMQCGREQRVENDRVECCLQVPGGVLDKDRSGKMSRGFYFLGESGVRLETQQNNQVCWVSTKDEAEGKGWGAACFLTVPEDESQSSREKAERRIYFKGRFSYGARPSQGQVNIPVSHVLESGRLKIPFQEGSLQLVWDGEPLTTGLGLYTSIYAKGIWYDSTQARWRIESSTREKLVVKGFWPWIPISQVWQITLRNDRMLLLEYKMDIHRTVAINIQETALMLTDQYQSWRTKDAIEAFPERSTTDDFFRMCLSANKADGVVGMSGVSDSLPEVTLVPSFMKNHMNIIENSSHIYNVCSRLFHCLCINQKKEAFLMPGEYEFFKGIIHINGKENT